MPIIFLFYNFTVYSIKEQEHYDGPVSLHFLLNKCIMFSSLYQIIVHVCRQVQIESIHRLENKWGQSSDKGL